MSSTEQAIATRTPESIGMGSQGVQLNSFEALERFAGYIAKSVFAPEHVRNNPGAAVVAIAYGMEIGLGPLQSIQNVKVIKGKPSIDGDTGLALVMSKGLIEWQKDWIENEADPPNMIAFREIKRIGQPNPVKRSFSFKDAMAAGLTANDNYKKYLKRMLQYRALGFVLRDLFPDVLKGLYTAEEAADMPDTGGNGQGGEVVHLSRSDQLKARLQQAKGEAEPVTVDAQIGEAEAAELGVVIDVATEEPPAPEPAPERPKSEKPKAQKRPQRWINNMRILAHKAGDVEMPKGYEYFDDAKAAELEKDLEALQPGAEQKPLITDDDIPF